MAVSISPATDYAAREANAPASIKSQLEALRAKGAAEGWTFEVGYTFAMDHPLSQITGMVPPENWLDEAKPQNARAEAELAAIPIAAG